VTGVFKANTPTNHFLLFVYGFLLKLPMFVHPVVPVPDQNDGFLFKRILSLLSPIGGQVPLIYPALSFLLLLAQAVTFNRLVSAQRLLQRPNYLTGMSYLLLTSLFTEWNQFSAPLIINTLLIWVWASMSSLFTDAKPHTRLFNIGMAIGVTTFFYFPAIAFTLLIIMGLAITKSFRLGEWLIALVGIITPYYFLLAFIFLTDRWETYHFQRIALSLPRFSQNALAYTGIGIVALLSLIGFAFVQQQMRRQLIQTRKSWSLIFLYLIVAFIIPFINATHSFAYWILCAIPLSVLAAGAFLYPGRKWVAPFLHWGTIAFILFKLYFPYR
jgi:hypothetical protein